MIPMKQHKNVSRLQNDSREGAIVCRMWHCDMHYMLRLLRQA